SGISYSTTSPGPTRSAGSAGRPFRRARWPLISRAAAERLRPAPCSARNRSSLGEAAAAVRRLVFVLRSRRSSAPRRSRPPRPRLRRTGRGRSSASFEPDPDLLSFDHALLAVEAVIAAGLEGPGQGLCLDVVGVPLDRAHEHAISVVARVDAVLHIEIEALA